MIPPVLMFAVAFLLDYLIGDPAYSLHPVRIIGRLIASCETLLRKCRLSGMMGGSLCLLLAVLLPVAFYLLIRFCFGYLPYPLTFLLDIYVIYSCIALRDMAKHARPVVSALRSGDIRAARESVQRIVGRDVSQLDSAAVARATVESVSESFVDGFMSPAFWFLVGVLLSALAQWDATLTGVAALLVYRCVNTMDSMVGYRNEKYARFGTPGARTDDVLNFLPARLSLLLMFVASLACRCDSVGGWRVAMRDRLKHASPNSAHTESFVAGALNIRLGGPTVYPHGTVEKPWLGDGTELVVADHVERACRLVMCAGALWTLILLIWVRVY